MTIRPRKEAIKLPEINQKRSKITPADMEETIDLKPEIDPMMQTSVFQTETISSGNNMLRT